MISDWRTAEDLFQPVAGSTSRLVFQSSELLKTFFFATPIYTEYPKMFLRLNINLAKYENDTVFLTRSLSKSDPLLLDFVADSSSSSSLVLVYLQFKPNLFPP